LQKVFVRYDIIELGEWPELGTKPKYSQVTLRFVESIDKEYPRLRVKIEREKLDSIFSIFCWKSNDLQAYVDTYRISDVTGDTAFRFLTDPKMIQLALAIRSVERMLAKVGENYKTFVKEYFWEGKVPHDIKSKRMRREVLTLVAFYLGLPSE
jgi:hypothetical protein